MGNASTYMPCDAHLQESGMTWNAVCLIREKHQVSFDKNDSRDDEVIT